MHLCVNTILQPCQILTTCGVGETMRETTAREHAVASVHNHIPSRHRAFKRRAWQCMGWHTQQARARRNRKNIAKLLHKDITRGETTRGLTYNPLACSLISPNITFLPGIECSRDAPDNWAHAKGQSQKKQVEHFRTVTSVLPLPVPLWSTPLSEAHSRGGWRS